MVGKNLRRWAIVLIGGLLVLAAPWFAAQAGPWREDRPITVGHRGTRILADENTLAAYQAAFEQGVDMIECDPRLTRDQVYVIMHDADVDRTTDGHGLVADLTLAEIKKLRTASGQEVPTLKEVLDFARDHDLDVFLDLKEVPKDGGALLVREIQAAGMVARVIGGCWDLRTCRQIEKLEPAISTCVYWPWPAATLGQAKRLGADAVGTLTNLATPAMIRAAHRRGLKVITMPINTAAELQEGRARGLDGLQSDDPRLLRPYGKKP